MTRTIESSKDYTKFTTIGTNRKVSKPHVKRLVAYLSENPRATQWMPILVNEKGEIIDGQHRFEACKELELPITFFMQSGLSVDEARTLNASQKPWTPMDYAESWAKRRFSGRAFYQLYVDMKKAYKLNHDILLNYITLSDPITGEAFRLGKMTAPDEDTTRFLCDTMNSVVKITGNKHRALAFALHELLDENDRVYIAKLCIALKKFYEAGKEIPPFKDTWEYKQSLAKLV